jgi:environmental stress-induced protein Ves
MASSSHDRAMLRCIALTDVAPQAWRNGGGRTRELLCWPATPDWALRISVADIDADGPFSDFPGVERWFAVIEGAGVTLTFADARRLMVPGVPPLRFDGSPGPGCRLRNGPTRDLNLMARGGRSLMAQVQTGVEWREPFTMRGLYAAAAGRWASGDGERRALPAHTLLWADAAIAAAWTFEPDPPSSTAAGWWLGFTPLGAER